MASEPLELERIGKAAAFTIYLVGVGALIVIISYQLASFFQTTPDKTLDLTNIFVTAILGAGATAIGVIEITKRI